MSTMGVDSFGQDSPAEPSDVAARRSRFSLIVPALVAATLGLSFSLAATAIVWHWEDNVAQRELNDVGNSHFLSLQNGLNEYLSKLTALRALFEARGNVERIEFETFAARLLDHAAAVQNLEWVPRVMREERAAFERAAARDIPGYRIKAVAPDDTIFPSEEKDEYLPILYSSLKSRTSPIYGIDLRSQSVLQQRLDPARDGNRLSAVPDFVLHSQTGNVHGFLFSLPVYKTGLPHETVEDRRRNLKGFVHGAFLMAEAFGHIMDTATMPRGVDLYVFKTDAGPNSPPLYVHGSRFRTGSFEPKALDELLAGRHTAGKLAAGDAQWTVVLDPIPAGPMTPRHDRAWLVLIASLFAVGLVVTYMYSSSRHAHRLLRANRRISELAEKDPLTGLANRRAFYEELAAAFATARAEGQVFAVLYFDLDHFKDINDTLGHPTGDILLRQVAERVKSGVRRSDLVARCGGDEFAILQRNAPDAADTATLAAAIRDLLGAPFVVQGNSVHVAASIGIVRYSPDAVDPGTIMVQADLALYRAKEEGRNCFRFHSSDLDRQVRERVMIADELRGAVQRGEMEVYYQPQFELATGRIVGLEALLRWIHPKRGLLLPSTFIPIAERTGTIIELGEWAFDQACRQLRLWLDQSLLPGVVAVNFSALHFKAASDLEDSVARSMDRWQIEPSQMEIELTESVLMEVTQQHSERFAQLRKLGLRIAIDDFGTGYSSLSYLTSYPVNRLKIGQDLVFRVNTDSRNASVVRAAIHLARELGIEFIAEGVETAAQADFLSAAGCEYAQGYFFSRPITADDATALLKQQQSCPSKAKWLAA